MSQDQQFSVWVGTLEVHYQFLGGLLFVNRPGVHELLARCSSGEVARRLAERDAPLRVQAAGAGQSGGKARD